MVDWWLVGWFVGRLVGGQVGSLVVCMCMCLFMYLYVGDFSCAYLVVKLCVWLSGCLCVCFVSSCGLICSYFHMCVFQLVWLLACSFAGLLDCVRVCGFAWLSRCVIV